MKVATGVFAAATFAIEITQPRRSLIKTILSYRNCHLCHIWKTCNLLTYYIHCFTLDLLENSPMTFTITNPVLNLAETDLAQNSPMSFTITNPVLNLAETDLAQNSPMSFTITQGSCQLVAFLSTNCNEHYIIVKRGKNLKMRIHFLIETASRD